MLTWMFHLAAKSIKMGISFDIIMHTRKLLQYGIFNHLTDDSISVLHHMIIQSSSTDLNKKRFFQIWRKGDFSENFTHMQLLQETNFLLQQHGEKMIEENFLEESLA
ncbi:MAG: hypothetical protein RI965_1083 [Bacteroidota bacterium]|jgi:hypothetical protein